MEYDAPFDPEKHGAEPVVDRYSDEPESREDYAAEDYDSGTIETDRATGRQGLSPVAIGVLLLALLLLGGGGFWWFTRDAEEGETATAREAPAPDPQDADEPVTEPAEPQPKVELPPLGVSDPFVRQAAARLSEHPALTRWLAHDDLVRRFVATVDNVASGQSPRIHLEFMAPERGFRAHRVDGELVARPETYARYDLLVDVFTSLDIGTSVQLYHNLEPLFEDAYREIAPPGSEFRDVLAEAIDQMLAVEIPEVAPELEEAVVSYRYADPELEALTPAQKHLLRLGPERARRVQTKLQFLQAGLDLSSGTDSI